MSSSSLLTKQWPLLRYAVEISRHSPLSSPNSLSSNEKQSSRRETIDCSEGLLILKLSTTQQLYVIRDQTENIECVDLLSSDSSFIIATYTGDSLLLSYMIPHDHTQRKFLVKFASTATQTGREQCEECVHLLSRSLNITHFDSTISSTAKTSDASSSIVSMSDMLKALMGQNSMNLSTYYNQEIIADRHSMTELLEKYLCDETFPDFVANIAAILDSMKEHSK